MMMASVMLWLRLIVAVEVDEVVLFGSGCVVGSLEEMWRRRNRRASDLEARSKLHWEGWIGRQKMRT